jgi:hypothetical protein
MLFASAFTALPSTGGEVWFAVLGGVLVWVMGRFPVIAAAVTFIKRVLANTSEPATPDNPNPSSPLTLKDILSKFKLADILDAIQELLNKQKAEEVAAEKLRAVAEALK